MFPNCHIDSEFPHDEFAICLRTLWRLDLDALDGALVVVARSARTLLALVSVARCLAMVVFVLWLCL